MATHCPRTVTVRGRTCTWLFQSAAGSSADSNSPRQVHPRTVIVRGRYVGPCSIQKSRRPSVESPGRGLVKYIVTTLSMQSFHPDPIQIRALITKNQKKITADKKNLLIFLFLSKTAIYSTYPQVGLHKVHLSYRRILQLSKEAIRHIKTRTLIFLPS